MKTKYEIAVEMWNEMSWEKRLEVLNQCPDFKSMTARYHAAIKFLVKTLD